MTAATRHFTETWDDTGSFGHRLAERTKGWIFLFHPRGQAILESLDATSSSLPLISRCPDLTGAPIFSEAVRGDIRRLDEFAHLEAGWDSYGAKPISPHAIDAASSLLMSLASHMEPWLGSRIKPYTVVPLASGGVQLEWCGPSGTIEVEADAQGRFSYLLLRGSDDAAAEEEDDVPASIIQDLVAEVLGD